LKPQLHNCGDAPLTPVEKVNVVDKVALCERIGEKDHRESRCASGRVAKLSHYGKPAKKGAAAPAAKAKKTDAPLAAKQPPAAESEAEGRVSSLFP